jgi:tetratricopeptide (TPR) repeat protein
MCKLCMVLAALFLVLLSSVRVVAQTQNQPPRPAASRSGEILDRWNDIGNKLIAMAQDLPEDKYDFKVQKDERTFAQNLLHAAALDFVLIRRVSGSNLGPDFGEGDNPSRDVFKTKADVVKFVQEAVADGGQVIQRQGDAGLDNMSTFFGDRLAHNSSIWTFAIEHSGEYYGQLVVYYRANNLVPPDSRRDQSQQPPAARVVDLKAVDGTILEASYFAAGKPVPGVLLLHQSNRTRKSWDELAAQLSAAGVARVKQQLMEARRRDPHVQLWPEVNVDIIGEDHMREGESERKAGRLREAKMPIDLAIEIFKLSLLAYPDSADAHYNLAAAYLKGGQKDLARQYAEKALAMIDSHKAPLSS